MGKDGFAVRFPLGVKQQLMLQLFALTFDLSVGNTDPVFWLELFSLCSGCWEERGAVCHLWLSGGDAEQIHRLLRVLRLELHRDLQVPLLHAGLHRHRVAAPNVAEIQPVDPSVPARRPR